MSMLQVCDPINKSIKENTFHIILRNSTLLLRGFERRGDISNLILWKNMPNSI